MNNFLEKALFNFVDRSTTENDFNIYNIVQVHWLRWNSIVSALREQLHPVYDISLSVYEMRWNVQIEERKLG